MGRLAACVVSFGLIFCASSCGVVNGLNQFRFKELLQQLGSEDKGVTAIKSEKVETMDDVEELFLSQRLDHFEPSSTRHFQQRYFYTSRFISSEERSTLAFLCVGGEGPYLTKHVLVDSVHCTGDMIELARKLYEDFNYNVHLFALEHRYYGSSYPVFVDQENNTVSPVTNENLRFLSSRQALGDIAHFVSTMKSNKGSIYKGMTQETRWVTFGGSYPGMMAGWARIKLPHLIYASVSSSAPIQAVVDYEGYNNVVGADLAYPRIGGSPLCLETFKQGHAQLASFIEQEENLQEIGDAFHLCNASALLDPMSAQLFLGDGVADVGAQGNDPSCEQPLCNIEKICSFVEEEITSSTSSAWEVLAKLSEQQSLAKNLGSRCLNLSWQELLDYIASPIQGKNGGLRSWLWQTCTEFGFYQTCEVGSNCPFGQGYHTLEQDLKLCKYAFGIDASEVVASVEQSLEYYGGWNVKGSRMLSVNGDVDPWSALARTFSTGPDDDQVLLPFYNVAGASHHFWTHPVKPTDDEEVAKARNVIHWQIMTWLEINEPGSSVDESTFATVK